MEPIDFYNANATNIVNVPRPGHPEDPSGIAGVRRVMEAQYFADNAPVMSLADACDFAAAYAHSRITSLAEEAEREAEAHYNIAPPHRYHADLDQCKFKRAIAAWLRQKAEER
jgi:hypothetical protein